MGPYSREDMCVLLAAMAQDQRHAHIDARKLAQVAALMSASMVSGWRVNFQTTEEHYQQPLALHLTEVELLHYALIEDSQGWLIWQRDADGRVMPLTLHIDGTKYSGGEALTACHLRAIRRGRNILDPRIIAKFAMADLEEHYRDDVSGKVTVQLLPERLENFREVGRVLIDDFDGDFRNVLRRAGGYLYRDDGQGFVQLLMQKFPRSFGDWPMAKLANVLALRLIRLQSTHQFSAEVDRLLDFRDLQHIEVGADYYRPLFFLRVGVLEIGDELREKLRRRELIEPGSQMEREYRALTILAARDLGARIGTWSEIFADLADETHAQPFLRCRRCRVGISDEELPCPYRPVCKATHEDHRLMDCGWPLVLTTEY
jgi:Potential Queuosine, Q, salvage protein family